MAVLVNMDLLHRVARHADADAWRNAQAQLGLPSGALTAPHFAQADSDLVPAMMASTALAPAITKSRVVTLNASTPPVIHIPREIVPGFVRGHVTLVVGAPSSGKSVFVTSLTLTMATGEACLLDAGTPKHTGDTLIVIGEDGCSTFEDRIHAGLKRAGLPWKFKHAIRFYGGDGRGVGLYGREKPDGPLMVLPDGRALLDEVRRNPPALIVFDTAASLFPSAMENDAGDATAVMAFAGELASASGACIVLVHHTGKSSGAGVSSQDATRGSRAWTASARTVVGIEPVMGDEAKRYLPGTIIAKIVKANHAPEGPIGHYRKVGVPLTAIDQKEPWVSAILSVVALEPVKAIAPADPLAGIDVVKLVRVLRAGIGGNPASPFARLRTSKGASAHAMMANTFALDPDTAETVVDRLVKLGVVRVEDRVPPGRGGVRARASIIVADDAEARVADAMQANAGGTHAVTSGHASAFE